MDIDKAEARRLQNIKNLKGSKGGRPKGSKNKIPGDLQRDLEECYQRLGGVDGLVRWAKRGNNKDRFYSWVIGLLPKQINLSATLTHYASYEKLSDVELWEIINSQAGKPRPQLPQASSDDPDIIDVQNENEWNKKNQNERNY